jgi:hypothetical protein
VLWPIISGTPARLQRIAGIVFLLLLAMILLLTLHALAGTLPRQCRFKVFALSVIQVIAVTAGLNIWYFGFSMRLFTYIADVVMGLIFLLALSMLFFHRDREKGKTPQGYA